jgi:hypothetical protein
MRTRRGEDAQHKEPVDGLADRRENAAGFFYAAMNFWWKLLTRASAYSGFHVSVSLA